MTIVLVGHEHDEHSSALQKALESRGRTGVLRCSAEAVLSASLSWSPGEGLELDSTQVEPSRASGMWRRPGQPDVTAYAEDYRDFVASESMDAFRGTLLAVDVSWLTSPSTLFVTEHKQVQLSAAHALGLSVPATLVTTSLHRARAFLEAFPASIVKPIRYGLVTRSEPAKVAWSSSLSSDLLEAWDGTPVIIQNRIESDRHLRIATVGDEAFVAVLSSSDLDWRSVLENHSRFEASKEFPDVAASALRLARRMRLGYTSQDWIIDSDGEAYFLEANPNGQWLFIDECLDGAVTTGLVTRLEELALSKEGAS